GKEGGGRRAEGGRQKAEGSGRWAVGSGSTGSGAGAYCIRPNHACKTRAPAYGRRGLGVCNTPPREGGRGFAILLCTGTARLRRVALSAGAGAKPRVDRSEAMQPNMRMLQQMQNRMAKIQEELGETMVTGS